MFCERLSNIDLYYNKFITQFGYVCLFSVAAPLTPLIILVLVLLGRYTNFYCIINLKRVDSIECSNGIGLYNHILKGLLFFGIISNISIVLFSSHNFKKETINENLIRIFFIFLAVAENIIIIFAYLVNWNSLPNWFEYIDYIRETYMNKYINKDGSNRVVNNNYIEKEG